MSRHTSGIHVIYCRSGDCVRIVSDVVFIMATVFADVIGDNRTTILQVDGVSPCTREGRRHRYKEDGDT